MQDLLRNVRYAVRQLLKAPVFTLTAALTLALGIGANTAIFSVLDSILLQPLPFPHANRLAHRLRRLGVGPDVLVGICAERTPEGEWLLFAVTGDAEATGVPAQPLTA